MINIEVKNERPPQWIWDKAHELFEIDDNDILFTYGNVIYFPAGAGRELSKSVIAHEATHVRQQQHLGGPDIWWQRVFAEQEFRKYQEIEAYQNQYKHFCMTEKDRNWRAKYLNILATHASSAMYKMGIKFGEAMSKIRNI